MPDDDNDPLIPRGYRRLDRGAYPLDPTIPQVANQYGDVVGQPMARHRFDPLSPYLPSTDEIQQAVQRREETSNRGAFWDLLALPEKVFFGQAVKGAVRGGAEGGFGGAVEGFLRGTPFAFASDWLFGTAVAKETTAADIRRAFGDTSEQTGVGNFFLNLAIDVALDPVTLMLNPFGKTAQGVAKAAEGVKAVEEASMLARSAGGALGHGVADAILQDFKVSASLEKAVNVGDRAAFVLKMPFAAAPFFESNLGFKSFSTAFGRSLDRTLGAVRVGPIGDLIRKVKLDYVKIADPEAAETAADLIKANERGRRQALAVFGSIMQTQVGDDTLKFVAQQKPEVLQALTTLREGGVLSLDDAARLTELADRPDVVLRRQRLERMLATDKDFRAAYETATNQTPEQLQFTAQQVGRDRKFGLGKDATQTDKDARAAYDAIHDVYRKHQVPLPADLMEAAQLPKRYGVELSAIDEPLTAEKIASAHPGSLSRGEEARAAAAAATPNPSKTLLEGEVERAKWPTVVLGNRPEDAIYETKNILEGVRTRLKETFEDLRALAPDDKAKINRWLEGSAYAMKELARMEALGHVMDASFEFYAGPYVYRMLAPEAKQLLNDHVRTKIAGMGDFGVNINERFLKNREFTDLLTIEASALAEQIGIKSTGYQPLKKLAELHNEHGADGVFGWILDKPFVRKLWEKDPEAAAFFSTNPLHNDYSRALASGRAMGKAAYFDALFDSPLKRGTSKMSELDKTRTFSESGHVGVIRQGDAGGVLRIKESDTATLVREGLEPEIRSRFDVAHEMVRDDLSRRLAHESADFMHEKDAVAKALDFHPDMDAEALKFADGDSAAVQQMKWSALNVRKAEDRLADARRALKAGQDAPSVMKQELDEALLEAKTWREHLKAQRAATGVLLDDLRASEADVVAMMKGGAADQRMILRAMEKRGVTPATMNRELLLWHRLKKEGGLALDEAKAWVGPDGKSLADSLGDDVEIHWFKKDEWEAAKSQLAEMNKPDMLRQNPIARVLDTVREYWGPYTAVNPLFLNSRVRDQVTNMLAAVNAGFKHWSSVPEAWKVKGLLRDVRTGNATPEALDTAFATRRLADGTAETMTRRQALDLMQANGTVTGTSMHMDEMFASSADYSRRYGDKAEGVFRSAMSAVLPVSKGVNSPVIRTGMQLAGYLDDVSRVAVFRDAWMRGMSVDQAADHVASTLYNSMRQSTSTERYFLRRVIPFYSFSRWALGQSADLYMRKPGVLATLQKVRDTSYTSPIMGGPPMDPAQVDTILPQFLKDGLGIPYKNTPEGPRYFMFGSYLPVGEVSQLVSGLVGMFDPKSTNGMLNYIGSKLNPALKVPLTMMLNRDFFSDRDVEKFHGEHRDFLGMSLSGASYQLAHNLRFLGEIDRLKLFNRDQAKLIVKAAAEGGTDEKALGQREELPFFERLAGSAFGFVPKTYLVDVANDTRFARQREAEKVNETKGLLRRRLIESQGKPDTDADVRALRIVLSDQLAEQAMMNNLSATYGVNAREQMKAQKRQDRLALSLLRDRQE